MLTACHIRSSYCHQQIEMILLDICSCLFIHFSARRNTSYWLRFYRAFSSVIMQMPR